MASGLYSGNSDIVFHLENKVDFQKLYDWLPPEWKKQMEVTDPGEFRETWLGMFESLGDTVCGEIESRNHLADIEKPELSDNGDVKLPPTIDKNMETLRTIGALGLTVNPIYGGLGAPYVVGLVAHELISRACPSTGLNACWYSIIADVVDEFGSEEQKQTFVPNMASGEWSGCMALTEPDAGSDLGALRTFAEPGDDGVLLTGSKRFISNGCGDLALVLAKNKKGAEGLKSLSMYLTPRRINGENNYEVTRIEDKIALNGSATCELKFDRSKGELIGKDGEGFRHMLELMNDSRLGVAFQGLGALEGIHQMAVEFAEQRQSWGKPISQHELIAERLLDMEVDLKAGRSLCYQAGYYRSLVRYGRRFLAESDLSEVERMRIQKEIAGYNGLVRKWTPLVKWWLGEKSVEYARECMQIHGGYGFTKEYRAEWWLRESMIVPIYEGTSQMQALLCVKDLLKTVIRQPNRFIEVTLGTKVRTFREGDALRKKLYRMKEIGNRAILSVLFKLIKTNVKASFSEVDLRRVIKTISRDMVKFDNLSAALLNAERLTEIRTLCSMGECLIRDAEVDPSRRWVAERFLNRSLPRVSYLKDRIDLADPVLAARLGGGGMDLSEANA